MSEFCRNGHLRTEENTSYTQKKDRPGLRRWCLDCRKAAYTPTGNPTPMEMSRMATTYLHEDIEDLLSFGATFQEIVERGGFSTWDAMYRSLKRRERFDLIEKLREKKKASV